MTRVQARETARDILQIVPLVMRTVAAELRAAGELPAPAHFGLLSILSEQPRMLTELASIQGVSLPTMSNSISAMVDRGWVRRTAAGDRPARRHHRGHDGGPKRPRTRGQGRRGASGGRARASRPRRPAQAARRPRRAPAGLHGQAAGQWLDVTKKSSNNGKASRVCI